MSSIIEIAQTRSERPPALPADNLQLGESDDSAEVLSPEVLRGGGYLAARYGLGMLISIGNMLVLTWWIGPHAYGVFVTVIGLVAFLANIARAGIDTYLVRLESNPSKDLYGAATGLILIISSSLALAGGLAIPFLARWYGSREFVAPYLVLLLSVPMIGLTGVPMAKLERELDFRVVAGIEFSGQALGLMVSIVLAFLHFGVWSPVGGQFSWQVFTFFAAWRAARLRPVPYLSTTQAGEMLRFGLGCTASLRVWQLRTLVNPLLVGRLAGIEAVAFVALALRIAESLGTFRLAAGRMAIATLARIQKYPHHFQSLLQRAMFLQLVTLGPLLCGFALMGPFIFHHIIGVRWLPSLRVYPFVAVGVLVNSIYNLQASALFVLEKQFVVMLAYSFHVATLALGTYLFVPRFGIVGYGWAELAACSAYLLIHGSVGRQFAISYHRIGPLLAFFIALLFA